MFFLCLLLSVAHRNYIKNVISLRFLCFLDLIQNFIKVTVHTMSLNLRLQYSSPPQGYHRSICSPQPSSSAALPSRGQSGPKYLWNVYQDEEVEGESIRAGVETRGESYRWGRWESMAASTHVTPHTEIDGSWCVMF